MKMKIPDKILKKTLQDLEEEGIVTIRRNMFEEGKGRRKRMKERRLHSKIRLS